ncbi:hypothetical protein VTL71DRAFT_12742 [Oculimacula yallundae]|uniref:Uncharacterized protein n=1 Tax=Oculimacula yallundae TaxID=86028 RepID=A0ABR4CPP3_9HELO
MRATATRWEEKAQTIDIQRYRRPVPVAAKAPRVHHTYKTIGKFSTCVLIDGQSYSLPHQANLMGNTPRVSPWLCSARPILSDFTIIDLSSPTCPFDTQTLYKSPEFDAKDKAVLTFAADDFILMGNRISKMEKGSCQEKFDRLSRDLTSIKQSKKKCIFTAIIAWSDNDQEMKWVRDSPKALLLQIGNIVPIHSRPPLSTRGWIAAGKTLFQDRFEVHVWVVYSAAYEHAYFKGAVDEWRSAKFEASFIEVEGSAYPSTPTDNPLPNMYLMHVNFTGKKFPRPNVDDIVAVHIPLPVPDCPAYTEDDARPDRTPGAVETDYDDTYEDGTLRTGGDGDAVNVSYDENAVQKVARAVTAEKQLERDLRSLQTWSGRVVRSDESTPPDLCTR